MVSLSVGGLKVVLATSFGVWPAYYPFLVTIVISCSFGYVVEGEDFLRDIKEGDIIVSAKVTEGLENLVRPK